MNRDAVQNERGPRTSTIRKHLATLHAKNKMNHTFGGHHVPSMAGLPTGLPTPSLHSAFAFRYGNQGQIPNLGTLSNLGTHPAMLSSGLLNMHHAHKYHEEERYSSMQLQASPAVSDVNVSSSSSESGIENVSSSKSDEIEVVKPEPNSSKEQLDEEMGEEEEKTDQSTKPMEMLESIIAQSSSSLMPFQQAHNNFRMLIAEICGKNLFNCVRWFKHAPMFTSFSTTTKVLLITLYLHVQVFKCIGRIRSFTRHFRYQ